MTDSNKSESKSLVKDFIEEFLDVRKGMLFTVRKIFLTPHRVYADYVANENSLFTNPFKLLFTVVTLLTLISVVVPSDEFEERLKEQLAQDNVDNFSDGYKLGSGGEEISEEKRAEIAESSEGFYDVFFEFADEYPLAIYLTNVLAFGIGLKTVFWRKITLSNSFRLACYISIPINIISGLAIYVAMIFFSLDTIASNFLVVASLVQYSLLLTYVFLTARYHFSMKIGSSVFRTIGTFIVIQICMVTIGYGAGAGFSYFEKDTPQNVEEKIE